MNFKMTRMLSRGIVFMFLAILLFLALVLIVNKFTDGDTSQLVTTIVTGFVAALTFASRDFFDADDKGDNGTVATVPAEIIPPDNTGPAGRFGDANGFLGSSKSDNNFANRWDDRGDRYPNDDGWTLASTTLASTTLASTTLASTTLASTTVVAGHIFRLLPKLVLPSGIRAIVTVMIVQETIGRAGPI